ncbi:MAG: hypothetical protein WC026_04390 [Hyphomicrobium sp.]|uniref:hypothetical protein n=1 Tax=Hyphomicrobium sp. TaxID=82 RepID=UPI00356ABFAB
MHDIRRAVTTISLAVFWIAPAGLTYAADLGNADVPRYTASAPPSDRWSFAFTTYGWIPWMSGNMAIKGHNFDVNVDPSQIYGNLDWSSLPAWMSYAEARRGPIGLFNDIVYANLTNSKRFQKELPGPLPPLSVAGGLSVDYTQVTVEFGGAYEIWSGRSPITTGSTAVDVLAGGRYWHQDVDVSATLNSLSAVKSGSVDWTDPFIGARLRNQIGNGQELMVRADVGGFGVGSDFSWQVLATYNWQMCVHSGYVLDGYVGYRALSVDFTQGGYKYDVLQQGPVVGTTLHF